MESNLAKEFVPLNNLRKSDIEWVIKVLVIERGSIINYTNARGDGSRLQLTFVDEEGTKVQTVLFNDHVKKWKDLFEQNKSYYIINGRVKDPNPNYLSVNKEMEISFTNYTIVEECNSNFSMTNFSNNFLLLEDATKFRNETLFDVVCILIKAKAPMGEGRTKRREIIVTDERIDRRIVTLWGDLAVKYGELLQQLANEKPVIAFCDVKGSTYQGEFGISTTPISSVLINPLFQKAKELQNWHESIKDENKDITLMPSLLMREAKQVKIADIINGSSALIKDLYCRFNAQISTLANNIDPWYLSCKKCYKKVKVVDKIANCSNCKIENADYEERYCLKISVSDGKDNINVTLFDATRYLLGCDVKEYIQSTSQKKENSKFYEKLLSSKDKEFTFLIKIDKRIPINGVNRSLIAEEMHEIEAIPSTKIEEEEEEEEEVVEIKNKVKITKRKDEDKEYAHSVFNKKIKIEKD